MDNTGDKKIAIAMTLATGEMMKKYKKRLMELDEFVKKKDEEKKLAKLKEDSKNGRKNIFSKKV